MNDYAIFSLSLSWNTCTITLKEIFKNTFLYLYCLPSWNDPLVHILVYLCGYCKLLIFYCQWFGFSIKPLKLQYPHHQLTHVHVTLPSSGASKIFCTYLLPCFLLENTKKIVFWTFNLLLAFQNKWNFCFFHGHL
jgi:hypothetical protein